MGRTRWRGLLVATLTVVALVSGAAVGSAAVSGAPAPSPPGFDPDSVRLQATVHANGSATWQVAYRLELDTPNESAAFGDLQSDIRANPERYERRFETLLGNTVRTAENATGREMALRGTEVAATRRQLPEESGVVTYTFTWVGFAGRDGDRLVAGRALNGLPLDEETTLLVTWPERYRAETVRPAPDERRPGVVVWHGPTTFAPDEPRLRLAPATPTPTAAPGPTGTATGAGSGGGSDPDGRAGHPAADGGMADGGDAGAAGGILPSTGLLPLAGVTLLAAGGFVGWLAHRRDGMVAALAGSSDGAGGAETAGAEAAETAAGASDPAGSGTGTGPPSELLSPEERVTAALESHGGRMKQQELAEELDWSGPKASRVVGDLREEGAVEVFRLGRENVVTLPEEEL